jgi:hypothetical protein
MSEVFISQTKATPPDPDLTPEAVAGAIARALDRSEANPYPDGGDFIYEVIKPYETAPRTG